MYAGLQTADTDTARMDVLIRELDRTGAFDRKVLVIVPTTGTGWINPVAARSIETMYNGDTAMVGVQYSYLPSWISFLGDRDKSIESGRLLIDRVHARWSQLPPDHRPKLVLYGESLGSMGGQGAFAWLPDIAEMGFSAVLWVGPPHESPLWSGLVRRRDPGTREVDPRYDNGRTVRFTQANDDASVDRVADTPWQGTRVLFLQHSSDPIVWWSPDLLFSKPDWLKEPAGTDRTSRHALVPDRHVLAGQRRHDERRGDAWRPRPQLRRCGDRRLGCRHPPGRLDPRGHRPGPTGDGLMAPRHAADPAKTREAVSALADWLRDDSAAAPDRAAIAEAVRLTARTSPPWRPAQASRSGSRHSLRCNAFRGHATRVAIRPTSSRPIRGRGCCWPPD